MFVHPKNQSACMHDRGKAKGVTQDACHQTQAADYCWGTPERPHTKTLETTCHRLHVSVTFPVPTSPCTFPMHLPCGTLPHSTVHYTRCSYTLLLVHTAMSLWTCAHHLAHMHVLRHTTHAHSPSPGLSLLGPSPRPSALHPPPPKRNPGWSR